MPVCRKNRMNFLKRRASVLMIAFMLGISNAILEETRMVNDTSFKIEHQVSILDENPFNQVHTPNCRK